MTTAPLGRSYTVSSDTQTTTMKTTTITWHPYPQEKPTEINNYILTTPSHGLRFGAWIKEKDRFMDAGKTIDVIAWAELPKAYEG